MDIISQLQEQVNSIAALALNTFGTLQRDAPPVRLSPVYPEPPANASEETINIAEQPKTMSAALIQAAKKFDSLVSLLPLTEADAQLKQIADLQAENEAVGLELQNELEAAGVANLKQLILIVVDRKRIEAGPGIVCTSSRQLFEFEETRVINLNR